MPFSFFGEALAAARDFGKNIEKRSLKMKAQLSDAKICVVRIVGGFLGGFRVLSLGVSGFCSWGHLGLVFPRRQFSCRV